MEYLGSEFDFELNGNVTRATIEKSIGSGATSDVYLGRDVNNHVYAVKIPKTTEDAAEEFLPEKMVITQIIEKQLALEEITNVPMMYLGELVTTRKKILVLELIPQQFQWMRLAYEESNEFRSQGVFRAAIQANRLFWLTYDLGILNIDIKIENFYWIDESRFVFLDWNRCINVDKEKDRFQHVFKLLGEFIYQVLSHQAPPDPLPVVDPEDRSLWPESIPRPIRRLLVNQDAAFLNFDTLASLLQWQLVLSGLELTAAKIGEKIQEIASDDTLSVSETYQRLLDLAELMDRISSDDPAFAAVQRELQKTIHAADPTIQMIDFEEQIRSARDLILSVSPSKALEILFELIKNVDALAGDKDKLFFETLLAETVRQGVAKFGLVNQNSVYKVIKLFEVNGDPSQSFPNADFSDYLKSQLMINAEYQRLLSKINEIQAMKDPVEKLESVEAVTEAIVELNQKLSDNLKSIFLSQIPRWHLGHLQKEVNQREAWITKHHKIANIKEELKKALRINDEFPLSKITSMISALEFDPLEDQFIFDVWQIVKNLENLSFENALIISRQAEYDVGLYSLVSNYVLRKIAPYKDQVLYAGDILRLERTLRLLPSYLDETELEERIVFAKKADYHSLDDLEECQRLKIEPWAQSPKMSMLMVSYLKSFTTMVDMQESVVRHQNQIQSQLNSDDIHSMRTIYEPVQESLEKFDDDLVRLSTIQGDVNQKIDRLNRLFGEIKLLKERAEKTQSMIDSVLGFVDDEQSERRLPPTAFENSLIFINWLTATLFQGRREDFIKAEKMAAAYLAELDISEPQSQIIKSWHEVLKSINSRTQIMDAYLEWISGLKERDIQRSTRMMDQLHQEEECILYQFLWKKHINVFGYHRLDDEILYRLFYQGKLIEIERRLNELQPHSQTEKANVDMWRYRINFVRNLSKFYQGDRENLGDVGGFIDQLLLLFAPGSYREISQYIDD